MGRAGLPERARTQKKISVLGEIDRTSDYWLGPLFLTLKWWAG
jgi:hypothetical protein